MTKEVTVFIFTILMGCGNKTGIRALDGETREEAESFNWRGKVTEPNSECPDRFFQAVNSWREESDVRKLAAALTLFPANVKHAACRVTRFSIEEENYDYTALTLTTDRKHYEIKFHPALLRLQPTLSQYGTWKDRRVVEAIAPGRFETDHSPIVATVSSDSSDRALEYILAHELGHVASFSTEWLNAFKTLCGADCDGYSWGKRAETSNFSSWHGKFCYYGACGRVPSEDLPKLYGDLTKSDFVSLYGSTNQSEDDAESFASIIVFDLWSWDWTVDVGGVRVFSMRDHWASDAMKAKRELVTQLAKTDLPLGD